ncbi:MAG: Nif3-like dinuclear metal center hexameric protein, partial [Anaerolineae bacterium]|nr:Nif3-like dinuclear metal center hexameric protein [Anaerolineae bacterium]
MYSAKEFIPHWEAPRDHDSDHHRPRDVADGPPPRPRGNHLRGHGQSTCDRGHESLYYPYEAPYIDRLPADWASWPTNQQRHDLLAAHDLTFLRLHESVDEICVLDNFANVLELGAPVVAQGLLKVYEIPRCSLGALTSHVKACLGLQSVRVSPVAGLDQQVHRVGLPWGGLGLFVNVGYQQELIERACDVFIAGESDNYGFRFSQEIGIPMIETSH